jgi:hypothetical protein
VEISVKKGFLGLYAISFYSDGSTSDALLFKVKYPQITMSLSKDTSIPVQSPPITVLEVGNYAESVKLKLKI